MRRRIAVILALALLLAACPALAADLSSYGFWFHDTAAKVGETEITSAQLLRETRREMILSAADGVPTREADVTDHLTIIDQLDKALFELEYREIIRQEAGKRGIFLSMAQSEECIAQARERYAGCRAAVEEYGAYMPAIVFDREAADMVGTYLAAWGLTEESLYADYYSRVLGEELKLAVAGHIEDEDERIDYYTDWLLERLNAVLKEEPMAAAEVALRLTE